MNNTFYKYTARDEIPPELRDPEPSWGQSPMVEQVFQIGASISPLRTEPLKARTAQERPDIVDVFGEAISKNYERYKEMERLKETALEKQPWNKPIPDWPLSASETLEAFQQGVRRGPVYEALKNILTGNVGSIELTQEQARQVNSSYQAEESEDWANFQRMMAERRKREDREIRMWKDWSEQNPRSTPSDPDYRSEEDDRRDAAWAEWYKKNEARYAAAEREAEEYPFGRKNYVKDEIRTR